MSTPKGRGRQKVLKWSKGEKDRHEPEKIVEKVNGTK